MTLLMVKKALDKRRITRILTVIKNTHHRSDLSKLSEVNLCNMWE